VKHPAAKNPASKPANTVPRLIGHLHPLEQKAILSFTEQTVRRFGNRVSSISLYGTGQKTARGFEDIEILVLTSTDDEAFEDDVLDTVAEIVVETGVYLTVKTFSQAQFKAFNKAGVAMVKRIKQNQIALFES
jgi:hypothetical protein